jgi:asparagine synthase (glutamine-hydrolysing)
MCGITGYISNNIDKKELQQSVETLQHRGPDNLGLFYESETGLGHSRLSILDLSDNANQPIFSHSGNSVMVFNGEIYNYKELSAKYNIKPRTTSDSEIILELFELLGVDFVNELNGMFAIAVFDKIKKRLFLFRDRLGIKPLFYFFDGENFAFASELKALFAYKTVKQSATVNKNTAADFLQLGYIPEPLTFFNKIFKFPSGNYAVFSKKNFKTTSFWQIEDKITKQTVTDEKEAKNRLNKLLLDSVEKRMISDVPLGTFLSGGTDSSLITALAQKVSPHPVKTFSIGFKESKYNEAGYAKRVAEYLKTEHHEFIVSQTDVLNLIDNYFNAYDEPFADSSGFPTMLVSKLAKKHVSVILSGDGGDELFHGYGMYQWANRLNNPLIKSLRKPITAGLSMLNNRYKRAATLFQYKDYSRIKSHIFSQEQYFFSEKELDNILINNKILSITETISSNRNLFPSEEQSIFDIKHYLKDDLLVKVDRASMQWALEVRVPLLDHRVVEFAVNVHQNLKIKNREQKYLLKQLLYDYVPKELFNRPKWGFSIPLEKWLKNELAYLLEKYTSQEIIEKYNIVNYQSINNLKKRYLSGQSFLYNRLWLIIVLHKHLENNNINST